MYIPYLIPITKNKYKNITFFIFKERSHVFFSYIIIEKLIYNRVSIYSEYKKINSVHMFNINKISPYYIYTYWTKTIYKSESNYNNIDPILRQFTSLFIYKSKLNFSIESKSMTYFNSYNYFYTNKCTLIKNVLINSSSNENNYFYKKTLDNFIKSEFVQIIQENNFIVFNNVYKLIYSASISKRKKKKIKKKIKKKFKSKQYDKLVSSAFYRILKKTKYITNTKHTSKVKFKVKLKYLFKFATKIKNKYKYINIPYTYFFNKKIKIKSVFDKKIKIKIKKKIKSIRDKYTFIKNKPVSSKPINNITSFIYKLAPTQFSETYVNQNTTEQVKKRVSILTRSRFSFYKLNALSITRFQFEIVLNKEIGKQKIIIKNKKSANFLNELERKIESRYRYIAIYIKDLVRITFFCIFLKKADFIANFYAFLLSKLPRKRKETKLIKCFTMILKVFSAHRPEMIGIRLRFQGRLNRWRRTKSITGQKGYLEYYSYKSRIEFGLGQAITRKGTQGIRIWLCYDSYFNNILKQSIFNYRSLNSIQNKF